VFSPVAVDSLFWFCHHPAYAVFTLLGMGVPVAMLLPVG
jgi:hypothetical protein